MLCLAILANSDVVLLRQKNLIFEAVCRAQISSTPLGTHKNEPCEFMRVQGSTPAKHNRRDSEKRGRRKVFRWSFSATNPQRHTQPHCLAGCATSALHGDSTSGPQWRREIISDVWWMCESLTKKCALDRGVYVVSNVLKRSEKIWSISAVDVSRIPAMKIWNREMLKQAQGRETRSYQIETFFMWPFLCTFLFCFCGNFSRCLAN